jgi:hypothetical protein
MTGLWWTYAATTYLVGAWERLDRPRTWVGLVFFLLGAMLYYSVYALFIGFFMLVFLVGMAFGGGTKNQDSPGRANGRSPLQKQPYPATRNTKIGFLKKTPSPLIAAALALVVAAALALLLYYGQFIEPILTRTLPKLLTSAQEGGPGLGKLPTTWPQYIGDHINRLGGISYGLLWPILLALGSLLTGWKHAAQDEERQPLRRRLLIAWIGTAVVFFLLGYRVDMVDKEIWFVLPALALCVAVTLEWLWHKGPAGRILTIATYLYLAAAGIAFWIIRLSSYLQEWVNTDAPVVGEVVRRVVAMLGLAVG